MVLGAPDYVGKEFGDAPPGHRFRLYFDGWNFNAQGKFEAKKDRAALERYSNYPRLSLMLVKELRDRQLMHAHPSDFVCHLKATSSFVTGMGLDHPIENGFAFLDPYGLPYLPGSSIKGVLRRAAEELALFTTIGAEPWELGDIWWLFGIDGQSAFWRAAPKGETPEAKLARETWQKKFEEAVERWSQQNRLVELDPLFEALGEDWKKNRKKTLLELHKRPSALGKLHNKGALECWDAVLLPPNNTVRVDVMTPHFSGYFQDKKKPKAPTDDQDPTPIPFMAMPKGTKMRVIMRYRPTHSHPPALGGRWIKLIDSAMLAACGWVGFGAKTTAGYGRWAIDESEQKHWIDRARQQEKERQQKQQEEAERKVKEAKEQRLAQLSPEERILEELREATKAGDKDVVMAIYPQFEAARGAEKLALAEGLREAFKALGKWEGKQSKKQEQKKKAILEALKEGGKA